MTHACTRRSLPNLTNTPNFLAVTTPPHCLPLCLFLDPKLFPSASYSEPQPQLNANFFAEHLATS